MLERKYVQQFCCCYLFWLSHYHLPFYFLFLLFIFKPSSLRKSGTSLLPWILRNHTYTQSFYSYRHTRKLRRTHEQTQLQCQSISFSYSVRRPLFPRDFPRIVYYSGTWRPGYAMDRSCIRVHAYVDLVGCNWSLPKIYLFAHFLTVKSCVTNCLPIIMSS